MKKTLHNFHYINVLKMFLQNNYRHSYNYYNERFILFVSDDDYPLFMSTQIYKKIIFLKSRSVLTKGDKS